ncbi:hypothetical protein NPIL_145971, partial [Nephila pilipes]
MHYYFPFHFSDSEDEEYVRQEEKPEASLNRKPEDEIIDCEAPVTEDCSKSTKTEETISFASEDIDEFKDGKPLLKRV